MNEKELLSKLLIDYVESKVIFWSVVFGLRMLLKNGNS
jgi:hypothetical protein